MDQSPPTSKTAAHTPSSSPGLFSPSPTAAHPRPASLSDGTPHPSPFLHPLQMHKVRETYKAQVEQDFVTGRKLINQYEIIDEIGRGVHGKVKLARSLETGDYVAIKIIQRFSKKRRLGRVTVSPEDKTKREIAILKKIRHPNVVGLLEIIDDPELKKIYMVLEHVELGEIVWRKKGLPQICLYERRRVEREQAGEQDTGDDEKFFKMMERRRQRKEAQRIRLSQLQVTQGQGDYWSLEHGDDEDDIEEVPLSREATNDSSQNLSHSSRSAMLRSNPSSKLHSRATSRAPSRASSGAHPSLPTEFDIPPIDSDNEEETPGPLPSISSHHGSGTALVGSSNGSYPDDTPFRGRSPSTADSIISHMSSVDGMQHDVFEDDYSYVPCFTVDQARSAFRDTVLGLEYLHYQRIVHRDIKPANLLWTKDHRVKISDFGVSYFGRPIREGEAEENISEADATDFDDDLELAKTVGTPAFFAPELCYNDLDVEQQPKVTEQIDVWSLGVTLYCLIFARLPFLADDEYQLFRCIAKNDVYIPRRRLKAVDPSCTAPATNLNKRINPSTGPYREEGELAFEDIDDELMDLLRRMLIKDPVERINLREVKRHPWVIRGIGNVMGWIDDSDPSRKTAGRRIQVDRRELETAVIPITFLERARSAVKKTVNKIIGGKRGDTRSEGSRRRAVSSATSSGTENIPRPPLTPVLRDNRRASLRGDESYFTSVGDLHEHPLAQSLTASPDLPTDGDTFALDFARQSASVGTTPKRAESSMWADFDSRPGLPDRTVSVAGSVQTIVPRGHSYSRSVNHTPTVVQEESQGPSPPGLFTDHHGAIFGGYLWTGKRRDFKAGLDEGLLRAKSVDRGLFASQDKHAEPSVAMSNAVAPGTFQPPAILHHPRPSRSAELSPKSVLYERPLPSPLFFQPYMVPPHQVIQSSSTPNVASAVHTTSNHEGRPKTANRTPERKTAPRAYEARTPESFQRAQQRVELKKKLEAEADPNRKELVHSTLQQAEFRPLSYQSPDGERLAKTHEDAERARSSSSVNSASASQLATLSDEASPISSLNLGSQEQFYPSVPSLPALVSGASSVSADPEGEFLQRPGFVRPPDKVLTSDSTPETLTPPFLSKKTSPETGIPTGAADQDAIAIALEAEVDEEGYNADGDTAFTNLDNDDDDSDSDEGLTMTRPKKKPAASGSTPMVRRETSGSVGSTETAKKVGMESS